MSEPAAVRYVRQEDPNGCLVACIAMVAGLTFGEAMDLVRPAFRDGMSEFPVDDALGHLGFAAINRWHHSPRLNAKRDPWPPTPFAPVHICGTSVAGGHHGVVMLADGSVIDPWKPERTSLSHPDFLDVYRVCGYWKVAG